MGLKQSFPQTIVHISNVQSYFQESDQQRHEEERHEESTLADNSAEEEETRVRSELITFFIFVRSKKNPTIQV